MHPDGKTPLNANISRNKAWWMPILEKAYAKYNVNYVNIHGGLPVQAFRDLTGMPAVGYYTNEQSVQKLFNIIDEADKKHWILSATCNVEIEGLHVNHVYTILGAVQLTD